MRSMVLPLLLTLLSHCGTSVSNNDERMMLVSLVELIEMDYVDYCGERASATWDELVGKAGALQRMLERDKAFGIFANDQAKDVRGALNVHALSADDDVIKRKVKLLLEPGDAMLTTEQWIRLVTFGDTALHKIRFAGDYDCGANANCTLREFQKSFASQQDEAVLRRMKQSWENQLPDLKEYQEQILPLLRDAAKDNNYKSVEEYWDSLAEYEGGFIKAKELWEQTKPLYTKLQKYVTLRLRGSEHVGTPLPTHLLRSLTGDDWSNVIESLLPKHPDIYQKLHANLQLKDLGGKTAYRIAGNLIKELGFGEIDDEVWRESDFNGTCPAAIVDSCKPNKLKINTCKDVSIGNYIEAHEVAMKIKYKEIAAIHSNNTYFLREANRYSALYEAIPGFASLLSLTPHTLDRAGLFVLERFHYRDNSNHNRLVLQLIIALRDLPKLSYYLAADEWRLKVLRESISPSQLTESWGEFRKNFSLIDSTDNDLLGHPYVLFNKPLIGKFMGLILKYQIYQTFAEELVSDDDDLVQHVADNNARLIDAMSRGYGVVWPEMVSELLAKREYGLEFTGITDYFRLLDEYLDSQLDPTMDVMEVQYEEPPEEPVKANEIPVNENEIPAELELESGTHEDISENEINVGAQSVMKHTTETSTVAVMEIKNPVQNDADKVTKEASYSTYWWIGVAVVIAVIVVLIAIVAKKRQGHKKQLERQRRENSCA